MTATRDDYTTKVKHQLDVLNSKIDVLEAQAKEARQDARETYRAELLKLRRHSAEAIDKLGEMKEASEDSWDKMVSEMEKVTNAFTHSFRYFKSQFRLPMEASEKSAAKATAQAEREER